MMPMHGNPSSNPRIGFLPACNFPPSAEWPCQRIRNPLPKLPGQQTRGMNPDHSAYPLGLGVKDLMPQKAPNEFGSSIIRHIQPNQAIVWVGPTRLVKVSIKAEESRPCQPVEQWEACFHLEIGR